jgi:hypothetical protein
MDKCIQQDLEEEAFEPDAVVLQGSKEASAFYQVDGKD